MGDLKAAPARKVKAFLFTTIGICIFVAMATLLHTPEQIAIHGLYIIGAGSIFTIGGQSLVDSIAKWRSVDGK